ncbi:D-alanyl-D-alanine carboxypeptidase [Paenibacillus dendritiformis]|uniref:D-alanyl-D-alanine carboxypeptidase family protein n=1 Tax=Paenibacillus dendritiformis TaxID=130049 RepID=UPI00143DAB4D|nr:D-alanyl-D-alanine carboxypeptidase family protein [Paenibacillus dendritiformis]NKI19861.1 D-alanyl-D-alanine carboxypeptidase [Paenibacillus dendritiformis]NRF99979.1 D-alanyl-D-alanine carboxypeptidase [Paenibacillus dendritiformis]
MIRFTNAGFTKKLLLISSVLLVFSSFSEAGNGSTGLSDSSVQVAQAEPEREPGRRAERLKPPAIHAKAAALIDVASGRILYSRNGEEPLPMASTTKIMTAIVAIESGKLSDVVKTSKRAFAKEGSSLYLRRGEEMSLHHLLYGLMLRSGNDAAVAIAEHVGGSEEGFVYMMNQKAEMLGLEKTQFRNPHGLDADGHYTTANDLARLSAYALHNPTFQEIVRTKVKTVPNPNANWDYKWTNKNKMLQLYEGADGVKTGYTSKALRCLVSSATRHGQQLAVVTLNDGNDWLDHTRLLDYGFSAFPAVPLIAKGDKIQGYEHLQASVSAAYPLGEDERGQVKASVRLVPAGSLDYRLGYRGTIRYELDGQPLIAVPLEEAAAGGDGPGKGDSPAARWFDGLRTAVGALFDAR